MLRNIRQLPLISKLWILGLASLLMFITIVLVRIIPGKAEKQLLALEELTAQELFLKSAINGGNEIRADIYQILITDSEAARKEMINSVSFSLKSQTNELQKNISIFENFSSETQDYIKEFNHSYTRYFTLCKKSLKAIQNITDLNQGSALRIKNSTIPDLNNSFEEFCKVALQLLQNIQTAKKNAAEKNKTWNSHSLAIISGIFLFTLTLAILFILKITVTEPIKETEEVLKKLSEGEPFKIREHKGDHELSRVLKQLGKFNDHLHHIMDFASNVAKNNFDVKPKMFDGRGSIAMSLINMRDNLKASYTAESERNWISKGLAELGNLVRKHENSETLYDRVLSFIIKYLSANQGTIYVLDDSDKNQLKLERTATYAFDRKKFISGTVEAGDGLVGQVFLERDLTILKDTPQDYLQITSGLGQALPNNLVLCPLITNDEALGVLEIATFDEFREHELEFIRQISNEFAVVIKTARINDQTKELLKESQAQTEALRAQEEEMRQNLEELQTTQEEVERISNRNTQILEQAIDAVITIDSNMNILLFNKAAEEMLGYTRHEMLGKKVSIVVPELHVGSQDSNRVNGFIGMARDLEIAKKDGSKFWGQLSLSKVDIDGDVQYTAFIKDITEKKLLEKELHEKMVRMQTQEEELRQNNDQLKAAQDEMEKQAQELQKAYQQAEAQKQMMIKSIEKLKQKEKENQGQTETLRAQEEELRQNMEELQSTQDTLEKRAKELERANQQAEAQKQMMVKSMERLKQKEKESQEQMEELRAQEEELRQNMEELQTTQDVLEKRAKELERLNAQSEAQKELMVRNMQKLKQQEKELQEALTNVQRKQDEIDRIKQQEAERAEKVAAVQKQAMNKLALRLKTAEEELKKLNDLYNGHTMN